ncbi:6-carboxytetrahydropterin synthase [Yunchengibacter salinarum]|uniref:6-carboxytetrahydropterin synthase n=1 Tax=Yunchengibacter salinarum TaxID=3133399 RepID=UPI0035B69BBD
MSDFTVMRRIGIDAGHRLADHGSKCRHLHGHRYEVEAVCRAREVTDAGEQSGMVIDFGFLKEEMMRLIDAPCDHGLILSVDDAAMLRLFAPADQPFDAWHAPLTEDVARHGYREVAGAALGQKLYLVAAPPTAECLARHWFNRLAPAVAARSDGRARLTSVRVWETPNCFAVYEQPADAS